MFLFRRMNITCVFAQECRHRPLHQRAQQAFPAALQLSSCYPQAFPGQLAVQAFRMGLGPSELEPKTAPSNSAPALDESAGFDFTTKDECEDYASCSGRYVKLTGKGLNQESIFLNVGKHRMLASSARGGWVILSMDYLEEFLETQPASFGGFHSNSRSQPHLGWDRYSVTANPPKPDNLSDWKKYPNTKVTCSAVSNSGVVRSREDFEDMRKQCIKVDCGGFAWRKPHFNQFGEEDTPPVCFFYRRTQAELKQASLQMLIDNHRKYASNVGHSREELLTLISNIGAC